MRLTGIMILFAVTFNALMTISSGKVVNAQAVGKISVSYSVASNKITLHEPVILSFTVRNDLERTIKFDLGFGRKEAFLITITQPDGAKIELPRFQPEGLGLIGRTQVRSKQIYTQNLLLNEWYEFKMLGKYEIAINLTNPMQTLEGKNIETNTRYRTSLEIYPRDGERLKQVCAALARKVATASSYDNASEAVLALSYVNDTVAVPYLDEVLKSNRLELIAIKGLERIANYEAVDVLISALKIQTGETSRLARYALVRIEQKALDQRIKERVRQALS